jgi:hypothetical protein
MPDLQVDLDALEDFGGRLSRITQCLDVSKSVIDSYDADYGASQVRDAMHHFDDHWHDGRKHVETTAKSLSSMATEAVKAFRKVDGDLAHQMTDNGGRK